MITHSLGTVGAAGGLAAAPAFLQGQPGGKCAGVGVIIHTSCWVGITTMR